MTSVSAEDPSTVRQFLESDLVDFMHLVIVPIILGRGVSLWEGASSTKDRFTVESVASPGGLTYQLWNRERPRLSSATSAPAAEVGMDGCWCRIEG